MHRVCFVHAPVGVVQEEASRMYVVSYRRQYWKC